MVCVMIYVNDMRRMQLSIYTYITQYHIRGLMHQKYTFLIQNSVLFDIILILLVPNALLICVILCSYFH